MPRPKSPRGPWVTVPVKVREKDLGRIDAARGGTNRSEWMREAAMAVLRIRSGRAAAPEAPGPAPSPAVARPAPRSSAPRRAGPRAAPAAGARQQVPAAPRPAVPPHRCPVKGYCPECGEWKGIKR